MKKIVIAMAMIGLLTISSCGKETEKVIERVEVQKGIQILSGEGAPNTSLGSIGDYYLDKNAMNLYGAKTIEGWGNPISFKGTQGQAGSKILSGTVAPTTQGNMGDWYIDTQNKNLYGPKTENGWGSGISLTGSNNIAQKVDFLISDDATTLLEWRNKNVTTIDMTNIPELANITKIGNEAFRGCRDLTTIKFTEKITTIGHSAFRNCSVLEEIHFTKNITSIGYLVFQNTDIKNVYIEATIPPTLSSGRNDSFGKGDIQNFYVPASALNAYKANAQWKTATDIKEYDPNTHQLVVTGSKLKAMP